MRQLLFSIYACTILLLCSVVASCQTTPSSVSLSAEDSFEKRLDDLIPSLLKRENVPALSVALIRNGKIVLAKAFGLANKSSNNSTTGNTMFQIGSVSKTVTALGVMKLAEEGRIKIDDPVEKYLKSWHLPPGKYDNNLVTIRMILSHTAGLSVRGYHGVFIPGDKLPTLPESLNGYSGSDGALQVVRPPGRNFEYSSGGYTLLQLLIQDVTGLAFGSYMHQKVFQPLDMEYTGYAWSEELAQTVATPYNPKGEPWQHYQFVESGSGGIYTTAGDLANLLTCFCKNGEYSAFVKPATVLQMIAPSAGTQGQYGFGCKISSVNRNQQLINHDGSNEGWKAAYYLYPASGDGVVVLGNSDNTHCVIAPILCTFFKQTVVDLSELCSGIEYKIK